MVRCVHRVSSIVKHALHAASAVMSRMTKPVAHGPTLDPVADLARSKPPLIAETLLLRQHLLGLTRALKRPHCTRADRALFVVLAPRLPNWKEALLIVKPETVLRWHRQGFSLFWKRSARAGFHEPKVPVETIGLIKAMAANNCLWGAERIQGESGALRAQLGSTVANRTVLRYMRQGRTPIPSGQTWGTFIQNHANASWACDFLPLHDLCFRPLFAFVLTELGSRRIVHVGVTRTPTDEWTAHQLREATPFGEAPNYLIRDNDAKYGPHVTTVAEGTGIEVLRTPVQAPRANAICERMLGSIRRECVDHLLILSEAHLRRVLSEYVDVFNHVRPHQGIDQRVPAPTERGGRPAGTTGRVIAFPVLGGLHHEYRRAA